MKIIGAGFGRTGTRSLKVALDRLGFGPCLHHQEVIRNAMLHRMWSLKASGEPVPWRMLFADHHAAVDWPAAHYWRELSKEFPKSKVILTVRDSKSWLNSMEGTIVPGLQAVRHMNPPNNFTNILTCLRTFGNDFSPRSLKVAHDAHIAEVTGEIDPKRLLVFNVRDGWPELCEFLGVAEPAVPFPHENTTREFLAVKERIERRFG